MQREKEHEKNIRKEIENEKNPREKHEKNFSFSDIFS